jgi:hypothetical protein
VAALILLIKVREAIAQPVIASHFESSQFVTLMFSAHCE